MSSGRQTDRRKMARASRMAGCSCVSAPGYRRTENILVGRRSARAEVVLRMAAPTYRTFVVVGHDADRKSTLEGRTAEQAVLRVESTC